MDMLRLGYGRTEGFARCLAFFVILHFVQVIYAQAVRYGVVGGGLVVDFGQPLLCGQLLRILGGQFVQHLDGRFGMGIGVNLSIFQVSAFAGGTAFWKRGTCQKPLDESACKFYKIMMSSDGLLFLFDANCAEIKKSISDEY